MILYIVRHGETTHNKRGIFMGHYDAKLSDQGIKQAKLLAKRLKLVNFDYIYSSDLARARRTSEEIAKFQNCKIQFSKQLRERKMGIFENQSREKYYEFTNKNATKDSVHLRLPGGGESLYCQQKRAVRFIEKIYKKNKGKTILISTHGGIKKVLLMYFKEIPLEKFHEYGRFGNTSLSIVKFHKDNKYKIELENDIKHLL
jgi:broad specificity phosphatase PhoE